MSIIRTDNEADAVEILKLVTETVDYYREMADVLEDAGLASKLDGIADERANFIEPSRVMVKKLGELPAKPDADKELVQKIGGELTQFFSSDSQKAILDKCQQEDEKLAEAIKSTKLGEESAQFQKLLDELAEHISRTKQQLETLKA